MFTLDNVLKLHCCDSSLNVSSALQTTILLLCCIINYSMQFMKKTKSLSMYAQKEPVKWAELKSHLILPPIHPTWLILNFNSHFKRMLVYFDSLRKFIREYINYCFLYKLKKINLSNQVSKYTISLQRQDALSFPITNINMQRITPKKSFKIWKTRFRWL